MKTYEFILSERPKTWNKFFHSHWTKYHRYKQEIRNSLYYLAKAQRIPAPLSRVQITVFIGFSTKHTYDLDSVCVKPHVDVLVDAGVIVADSRFCVSRVLFDQETTDRPRTRIVVEELAQ